MPPCSADDTRANRRPALSGGVVGSLVCTLVGLLLSFGAPARAWNVPAGSGTRAGVDTSDVLDGYYRAPHAYILQHAIEILDHDGYANWAAFARQFQGDLIDGARFADRAGPPLELTVSFSSILTLFIPVHDEVFGLCNFASLQHYYCPETGAGLNLSDWGDVRTLVGAMPIAELAFLGGAVMTDISISPPLDFGRPYPSAASRAQEEFDLAEQIYREGKPLLSGRTPWASAMFHLGWACHLLADCTVSAHTVSDKFIGHDAYEKVADDRGAEAGLHATTVSRDDPAAYHMDWSMEQMVVAVASETRPELAFYDAGKEQWDQGVRAAIPRAEQYTARALARFFDDVGLSAEAAPLAAKVLDAGGRPLRGAYVFFREGSLGWSYVQADGQGVSALSLKPGSRYDLRPAMPGYAFIGRYDAATPNMGDIPNYGCPVSYKHAASPIVPPTINFYLDGPPPVTVDIQPRERPIRAPRLAAPAPMAMPRVIGRSAPSVLARPGVVAHAGAGVSNVLQAELRTNGLIQDQLQAAAMGWREEAPPDLWQNTPRTPAYVKVQVQHLADMQTGMIVTSRGELARMANAPAPAGRPARGTAVGQEGGDAAPPPPEQMAAFERLPLRSVVGADGVSRKGREFAVLAEGNRDAIRAGLLPVPAPGGVAVRAEIVPDYGHVGIGASAPTVRIFNTDSAGVAWVRVRPGNQAGPLRLRLTVVNDPDVSQQIWPSRTVDLLVQPEWAGGKDVFPVVSPVLEQPDPAETGWPGAAPTNPELARPPAREATVPRIPRRPNPRQGGTIQTRTR